LPEGRSRRPDRHDQPKGAPPHVDPAEVADRCQFSAKTVLRAIRRGHLRASQLGSCRAFRIRSEDVDTWIAAKTVLPPLSASFRLPADGRLVITKDDGRHGHRAPDATA
jgi:excisionase family DNA binding protein